MQKLMSLMRSAMEHYNMVQDGDRIAVGISGGKDSLALLCCLSEMRRFYPKKYELVAVTLDPCFDNTPGDYSAIEELCIRIGVPYHIRQTELAKIIFETRRESNPCSLCARMRRGILHDFAKANGCNKLALGHHADDAEETFFMNLLFGGTVGCFSPVSYLSRKDLTMIRPMVFARESAVEGVVGKYALPVIKSRCPVDGNTQREHIKAVIQDLDRQYGQLNQKVLGALQRGNIDRW